MPKSGSIRIVYGNQAAVSSSYKIIADGRMSLNAWKTILANNKVALQPGALLVFTIYIASSDPYLVVNLVPEIEL